VSPHPRLFKPTPLPKAHPVPLARPAGEGWTPQATGVTDIQRRQAGGLGGVPQFPYWGWGGAGRRIEVVI